MTEISWPPPDAPGDDLSNLPILPKGPKIMFLTDARDALKSAIRNIIRDVKAVAKAPRVLAAIVVAETRILATRRNWK